MQQQSSSETVTILHELDLGQHTLFVWSDKTVDLLAHDKAYHADNLTMLNRDEAYRLLTSLQTLFQQEEW